MKSSRMIAPYAVLTLATLLALKTCGADISTAAVSLLPPPDPSAILPDVSAIEMPAQAARLVAAAKASDREAVTKAVVTRALTRHPMIASALVGAIAQNSPDMAAAAAVTAAGRQPVQIGPITVAAVAAAPRQAGKIVFTLCQQFPTRFNLVAMAATEAAPQAGPEILAAVAAAVPVVKSYTGQSRASTVAGVISDAQYSVAAAAQSASTTPDAILAAAAPHPLNSAFAYAPLALPPPTLGPPFVTTPNPTPVPWPFPPPIPIPPLPPGPYSNP